MAHAQSFEDLLRRIEEIEHRVNELHGETVMCFQSTHRSKGRRIGGRTGAETVVSVGIATLSLLGGCLYLFEAYRGDTDVPIYAGYLLLIVTGFVATVVQYRGYRYRRGAATPEAGSPGRPS